MWLCLSSWIYVIHIHTYMGMDASMCVCVFEFMLHSASFKWTNVLFCANICRCVNVCARECSEWNGSSILIVQIYMQQEKQQQHSTEKPKQQQIWPKKSRAPSRTYVCASTQHIHELHRFLHTGRGTIPSNTITFWKVLHLSFQHEFQQMFSFDLCYAFVRSSSFFCNFLASHQYHVYTYTHT